MYVMMLSFNFDFRPSSLLVIAFLALLAYITHFFIQSIRVDAAIRRTGGQRAHVIYSNPFSAIYWSFQSVKKASQYRVFELYDLAYGKLGPGVNVYEHASTPRSRIIETREPAHIKAVLASDFESFGKGPRFHQIWSPFLGDSIFTTDGKQWQKSRALIRPMFMTDRLSDLYIFERQVGKMLHHIPPSGQTIDIMDLFFRMTLDVTTDFLLGESANTLDNPNSEFTRAFNDILTYQLKRLVLRIIAPFNRLFSSAEYYRCIAIIDRFLMPYIERTLAIPPEELEKLNKSDDSFTFLHNLAQFTRDPKVIRDQLVAVLLAGRDTTAATLSWAFYELAAYPEKYERLRAEVLEYAGEHDTPTYEMLKNMKYLRYTINETLRLHPAVPFNIKEVLKDSVLPGAPGQPAIGVLKGDTVCYNPMTLHGRRDLYPAVSGKFADPSLFSPERWFNWFPKPWEYIPFNGGPRTCPGQNFAQTEMAYCIVKMLQKYERMEYRGNWHAQLDKTDVVSRPAFGVPVAFYEPSKSS
ncbi:cytochrome P450 [Xylariaceae sp. FL0255]|nr:cytochrome P450 [Xylariaceae sp. FL0255]